MTEVPDIENKEEMFVFLDDLKESGVTNMLGAGAYIQRAFFLEKSEALKILKEWMETYQERHSDDIPPCREDALNPGVY